MPEQTGRPAHIQRCTYTEVRGISRWQCRLADPHPDLAHDFPVDAEFGRILHDQTPDWLAAQLRDRVAVQRNMQARLDALQAVAMDLAAFVNGTPPRPATATWLHANAPADTALLNARYPNGWSTS